MQSGNRASWQRVTSLPASMVNGTDRYRRYDEVREEADLLEKDSAIREKEQAIHEKERVIGQQATELDLQIGARIELEASVRALDVRRGQLEQWTQQLQSQVLEKEARIMAQHQALQTSSAECQRLVGLLSAKETELHRVADLAANLSQQLESHASELLGKEEALQTLTRLAEQLHTQAGDLRTQLLEKQAILDATLIANAELRHEVEDLRRPLWQKLLAPVPTGRRAAG